MTVPASEAATGAAGAGTRRASLRAWLAASLPVVLLISLLLALLVSNLVWLTVHRQGGALNIDEADYLSMSITDYGALRYGGPSQLVHIVSSQSAQAPLVPLLSSFVYVLAGRPTIVGALAVQLFAYLLTVMMSYLLGTRLAGRWAGLVAALAVASLPIFMDYAREYIFAVPAAAAATVAIWAALRSDWMRSIWYSVAWGASLGVMLLARTMAIAFIPGFALMAALYLLGSPQRKRSLVGLLCGLAAGLLVAGPWYAMEGRNVWRYLTAFGYGTASAQYGVPRSVFSPASWLVSARDNISNHIWLPLTLVLVAGGVALVVVGASRFVRHPHPTTREVIGSPWFCLAVIVVTGLVVLQSSRNTGSAFPAPIVPAMMILAVASIAAAMRGHRSRQYVALGAIAALCLPSLIVKSTLDTATRQPMTLRLPGLAALTVVDARSQYLIYVSPVSAINRGDPSGNTWRRANDAFLTAVDEAAPQRDAPILFAFSHRLINTNTLRWEELMTHGASPPIVALAPVADGSAGYRKQLEGLLGAGRGVVVLCSDPQGMFDPVLDQDEVRAGLTTSGFALAKTVTLPDGAAVEIWTR